MPDRPRVLIANAVALNGGDGAILLAIREHLRKILPGELELIVADRQGAVAARHYDGMEFVMPLARGIARSPEIRGLGRLVRELNMGRWLLAARTRRRAPWLARRLLRPRERRKLEQYAQLDLVVSTGGTYLVEQYLIWPRLFELQIIAALGVPLVLYTQSLGPFRQALNRRLVPRALAGARLVLLRDERSRGHLLEIGVEPDRLRVVADAVFTFADERRFSPPPERPARVAISVRDWPHAERAGAAADYEEAVGALVVDLVLKRGAEVVFVSTCQGIPEYWTDDSRPAQRVVDRLPDDVKDRVTVDGRFRTPEALIEELRGFDVAVATRMHLAILALSAGVPVLPIAYEFKTRELFERLGLGEHVQDIEDLRGDDLVRALDRFWAARGEWSQTLPDAVRRERELADTAVDEVRAAYGDLCSTG